jgi:phenylalanyl-tRNA synthetase beta chain
VGVLVMGDRRPPHFTDPKPPRYDQWDAKALAERLVEVAVPDARAALRSRRTPRRQETERSGQSSSTAAARGTVRTVPLDAPVWALTPTASSWTWASSNRRKSQLPSKSIHGQTAASPR